MNCPICNSDKFKNVFVCTDHFVSSEKFDIAECENCGFRVTKDFPQGDKINRYYKAEAYISHSNTREGLVNKLYHRVRSLMLNRKASWVKNNIINHNKNLLDLGCGTGYFLAKMKFNGWHTIGIEKSEEARSFAKQQFQIDVFSSIEELESNLSKNKKFEVITLWHVLEHLEDLNKSMQWLYERLCNDGTLFIAVPNHTSADAKKYKEFWAAYDVPRHLWHFSPNQMQLFAQNHGFEIVNVKPFHFDGFYISMMSEKYKKSSIAFIKGFISGLSTYILSLFNNNKSSSLLFVLRKKGI